MLATQVTTSPGGSPRRHVSQRRTWLLAILAVTLIGFICLKGLADEAATRRFLTTQATNALAGAVQGTAQEASVEGVVSSRVAVTDQGRTYYVVDFANTISGSLLVYDAERWTLLTLDDDTRVPPYRIDGFTIHQRGWTRADAAATITFVGFLGRTQTIHVAATIQLPHFKSRFGWQPAP